MREPGRSLKTLEKWADPYVLGRPESELKAAATRPSPRTRAARGALAAGREHPLPAGHVVIDLPALSETEQFGVWLCDVAGLAARYRAAPASDAALRDKPPRSYEFSQRVSPRC